MLNYIISGSDLEPVGNGYPRFAEGLSNRSSSFGHSIGKIRGV
jgi:hypothetical protein